LKSLEEDHWDPLHRSLVRLEKVSSIAIVPVGRIDLRLVESLKGGLLEVDLGASGDGRLVDLGTAMSGVIRT
jgi:hypothetical protein